MTMIMCQENDTFYFQDENFIRVSNNNTDLWLLERIVNNNLIPHYYIIDNKIASPCSIEETIQNINNSLKTTWLLLHVEGSSNVLFFTAAAFMHNSK